MVFPVQRFVENHMHIFYIYIYITQIKKLLYIIYDLKKEYARQTNKLPPHAANNTPHS